MQFKHLRETIRKRKSVRKYAPEPLSTATLEWVQEQITAVTPLYPNIRYSIEIVAKTKGLFNIKAPHYLVFSSEESGGFCENIGFIGQQLDLALSESGIGTCWLGASKPTKSEENPSTELPFVIAMSFGTPAEPLHRDLSEFKRKPLSVISEGDDPRLEAARLTPTAMNSQNYYFIAENEKIHCYRKKVNPIAGLMLNKMNQVDMGIAICHIAVESDEFKFAKSKSAPTRKGFVYSGTVC